MKGSAVFATGQPTQDGLATILRAVQEKCPTVSNIVWVCLREEPLVMINGQYPSHERILGDTLLMF